MPSLYLSSKLSDFFLGGGFGGVLLHKAFFASLFLHFQSLQVIKGDNKGNIEETTYFVEAEHTASDKNLNSILFHQKNLNPNYTRHQSHFRNLRPGEELGKCLPSNPLKINK